MARVRFHRSHMDPCAGLTREWNALAAGPLACQAIGRWAEQCPDVAGFESPAALITTIGQRGHPNRSCRLLGHLLVLASVDDLAARATLQAVLPGLRGAARRRWLRSAGAGPWGGADEVTADAVSAGWEAVRAHAGQRHDRPAAVIVRRVEGRLRRAHQAWRQAQDRTTTPGHEIQPGQAATDAAYSAEHQATTFIADAMHAGVLDATEASLLLATGVLGQSVAEVERSLGMTPKAAYRIVSRARTALTGLDSHLSDRDEPRPIPAESRRLAR